MNHEDALRRRAHSGTHRGADAIWAEAHRSRGRGPRRVLGAAAILVGVVAIGSLLVRADDPADTDVVPSAPATSTPTDDNPATVEPDTLPICEIAILNASGRPGVAALAVERVSEFLRANELHQPDGTVGLDAYNALGTTAVSAVLLPVEQTCRFEGLSADPTAFPEPTLAPWPEEHGELVPPALAPATVIVVLGSDSDESEDSASAARVVVPELVGAAVDEALGHLAAMGFDATEVFGGSELPVRFTVPAGGELVEVGSSISIFTEIPADEFSLVSMANSLESVRVLPCVGATDAEFAEYRSGDTPDAPRAATPDEAAASFVTWINARPTALDGFDIANMPAGWFQLRDPEGEVAFGWTAPGTDTAEFEYHQLLFAETNGTDWWIRRFETSGC